MSVRKFFPEVRIAKLLAAPGGASVAQALERAAVQLECIREECMHDVDLKLARMAVLANQSGNDATDDELHRLSNDVLCQGGGFGHNELANIAHSLCTFVSAHDRTPLRNTIIGLHVEAMKVLRNPGIASDARARLAVQDGLRQVVAKHTAAAPA